jgi:NDP-sugar pyrophosphorylase family protein
MNMQQMKAVILAGGKGTRFHPFSFVIPKPLMPIGEEPILLHLIKRFKKNGFHRFLVSTGYQSELIRAYFGNGERFGVEVQYFHENQPLGTAGPLSMMRSEFREEEYFFLINGDVYTEVDFTAMADYAQKSQLDVIVGYVKKKEKSSFGILSIQAGRISSIIEKPERDCFINSGIYLIRGKALRHIPDNKFFTMPDLIKIYLENQMPIGAYLLDGFWIGIENPGNLDEVLMRIDQGKP